MFSILGGIATTLISLTLVLVVIGITLLVLIRNKESRRTCNPFEACPILTLAEQTFWLALQQCLPEGILLFSKVRLADIVNVRKGLDAKKRFSYFNRISRKHIDFILCSEASLHPVLAIELDDTSHRRESVALNDKKKDDILKGAKIGILRIRARRKYNTADLKQKIDLAIESGPGQSEIKTKASSLPRTNSLKQVPPLAPDLVPESPPVCPKCGETMVLRKAKRGQRAGNSFYGCKAYPKCRAIVNIKPSRSS